jgi:hypothetical protein
VARTDAAGPEVMALVAGDAENFRGKRFVQQPDNSLRIGFASQGHRTDLDLTNSNDCIMFTYGSLERTGHIPIELALFVMSKHKGVVSGRLFRIAQ